MNAEISKEQVQKLNEILNEPKLELSGNILDLRQNFDKTIEELKQIKLSIQNKTNEVNGLREEALKKVGIQEYIAKQILEEIGKEDAKK